MSNKVGLIPWPKPSSPGQVPAYNFSVTFAHVHINAVELTKHVAG